MTTIAYPNTGDTGQHRRIKPNIPTPPTQFGRESADELVTAGYDLARRATGKALERVSSNDAARALIELADRRDDVLRLAEDYLGYVTFDVPLAAQVDALVLVEQARYELSAGHATPTLVARLRRVIRPGS
jgi:hypothetical protein